MIQAVTSPIFQWVEKKSEGKYYPFFLSLILMLVCWFFVFPKLLFVDAHSLAWETVTLKANDLTNSLTHVDPTSWLSKKVFRLTVPFIMKLTHLPPFGIVLLQYCIGFLIYFFSFKLSKHILKDAVSATLVTAGIAFLYIGRVAFIDVYFTWFDAFAYFFLLLALYSNKSYAIFAFSLLAAWTDERAFIALSAVFIFHLLQGKLDEKLRFKHLFQLNKGSLATLAAIAVYLAMRLTMTYAFDMHTPRTGANLAVLGRTLPYMPVGIWTFFEGFWLIIVAALLHSFMQKNYLAWLVMLAPLVVLTVVSGCVTDTTRSGSYLFPMLFVFLYYMKAVAATTDYRKLFLACFLITLLFPATIVCSDWEASSWFEQSSIYTIGQKVLEILAARGM